MPLVIAKDQSGVVGGVFALRHSVRLLSVLLLLCPPRRNGVCGSFLAIKRAILSRVFEFVRSTQQK